MAVQSRLKDGRVVRLRAARPDDAGAFASHVNLLRESSPYIVTTASEAAPVERVREDIAAFSLRPGGLLLIAEPVDQAGVIVGDCGEMPFKEERMAHVGNIGMGVAESWRGCGLGGALLGAVIEHAKSHPALRRLELGVMPENTAGVRLYASLGFCREGIRPKRFKKASGGYFDELIMGRCVATHGEHGS